VIDHVLGPVAWSERRAGLARSGWRPRHRDGLWRYRLASVVIVAVLWQLFSSSTESLLVPTFTETLAALVALLGDAATWRAIFATNVALAIGFGLSVAVGIPLGFAMGRSRIVGTALKPYVTIMLVAPMAALIPLVVMAVGIGLAARVVLVMLFAVPMIVVNAQTGVRSIDPALIDMGRSFGASERQVWRRVLWPASIPAVMAGIRIGLGRAITAMILAEILILAVGLGGLLLRYRGAFRADLLYATTFLVVVEALILVGIARVVERRAAPWSGPPEDLG
jgi:NitT/TauT family transport system permease protein